jgi:hypothetical protein
LAATTLNDFSLFAMPPSLLSVSRLDTKETETRMEEPRTLFAAIEAEALILLILP